MPWLLFVVAVVWAWAVRNKVFLLMLWWIRKPMIEVYVCRSSCSWCWAKPAVPCAHCTPPPKTTSLYLPQVGCTTVRNWTNDWLYSTHAQNGDGLKNVGMSSDSDSDSSHSDGSTSPAVTASARSLHSVPTDAELFQRCGGLRLGMRARGSQLGKLARAEGVDPAGAGAAAAIPVQHAGQKRRRAEDLVAVGTDKASKSAAPARPADKAEDKPARASKSAKKEKKSKQAKPAKSAKKSKK